MVECQHHCLTFEVPNKGNGKELAKMLICQILWLLWLKEHRLEQVIKRPHFKVLALTIREINI